MYEKIGKYIWINNFKSFSLSRQKGKEEYIHSLILITKLTISLLILLYFKLYIIDNILSIIVFTFFSFLILMFLGQLLGMHYKPSKNIITYNRIKNTISIRISYFKPQTISITKSDQIILKNIKESIKHSNKTIYAYQTVVYYKDFNNKEYEMFIVNPTGIFQKGEAETIYELKKIANTICNKMAFVIGIEIIEIGDF